MKILFMLLSIFITASAQAMLSTSKEVAAYLGGKTFESDEVLLDNIPGTKHRVRFIFSGNLITIKRVFSDTSYKKAWLAKNPIKTNDLGSPFYEETLQEYIRMPGNSLGLCENDILWAEENNKQKQLESHTPDFSKSAKYSVDKDYENNFTIDMNGNSSGVGMPIYWMDFYDNFPKIVLNENKEKITQIEWKGRNTTLHIFVEIQQ